MKILAIGDIHGDTSLAKKAAKKAEKENVDLVLLTGDLTFFDQPAKDIIKPFEDRGKDVLILPGNHEANSTINSFADTYSRTKNLHGTHFEKNNIGFFGAGYSTDAGPFWIEDKEIMPLLKKGHKGIKHLDKKILVTHMHPKGSKSEFSGFKGSKGITEAIEKLIAIR